MEILNKKIGVVVLAAGKGTRLNCVDCPKVMIEIGGKPIVSYIIETLYEIGFTKETISVVVGFQKQKIEEYFGDKITYAHQESQEGTAHAAFVGMKFLPNDVEHVLVLGGDDSAFYKPETIKDFIKKHVESNGVLSLLTAEIENTQSIGRVVRNEDGSVQIVEKEYLTEEQKKIKEISTGTYCFDKKWFEEMFETMPKLEKLGEYGLPTAVEIAREKKLPHQFIKIEDSSEWFGVNTPEELDEADKRKSKG